MNNEIDIGQFSEALNNKLDTATFIANTLGVTASKNANSVLTTVGISKTDPGYVKFGNGFMIQWGGEAGTGSRRTQTLSQPFTMTSYFVNVFAMGSDAIALNAPIIDPVTMTTTTFDVLTTGNASNVGFRWVAFGW